MPFTEHLRELRNRLLVVLVVVGVVGLAMFWPSQFAIPWLTHMYFPGEKLHAFAPTDVIMAEFKFSLYAAIVIGLPVILYQIWMFVVPAVNPKTRKAVYLYVAPSFFLGLLGIAFAHFVVLPRVAWALELMNAKVAESTYGVEPTVNLILLLLLAFAIVFQTPVIMILLARIGIINSQMLRKYRRYAAMGILLFGGLAAPDASPTTMLMIAIPMYLLFEVSIWIIMFLEKSWRRDDAMTA